MFEGLDRPSLEKINDQAMARIVELEDELDDLRELQSLAARFLSRPGPQLTLPVVTPEPSARESAADYSSMPHFDAAKDVLRRAGGPVKTGPLTKALEAGGVKTNSKFFRNNVNTMMMRMANDSRSGIKKTDKGWLLVE